SRCFIDSAGWPAPRIHGARRERQDHRPRYPRIFRSTHLSVPTSAVEKSEAHQRTAIKIFRQLFSHWTHCLTALLVEKPAADPLARPHLSCRARPRGSATFKLKKIRRNIVTRFGLLRSAALAALLVTSTGGLVAYAAGPIDKLRAVTGDMLKKPDDGDWVMWRRTYDGWGYSPLDQINKDTVK